MLRMQSIQHCQVLPIVIFSQNLSSLSKLFSDSPDFRESGDLAIDEAAQAIASAFSGAGPDSLTDSSVAG
jgi:hypothetical protein